MKLIAVLLGLLSFGFGTCTTQSVTDPQRVVFPDTLVSYRNHVAPFLGLSCSQCHGNTNPAGGINLTNYSSLLFSRPNLVVPTLPDESLLNQVLENVITHPVGNIPAIPQNQIAGMRIWVREGAQNN